MLLTTKTMPESAGYSPNRLDLDTINRIQYFSETKTPKTIRLQSLGNFFFICLIYLCNKAFQSWKRESHVICLADFIKEWNRHYVVSMYSVWKPCSRMVRDSIMISKRYLKDKWNWGGCEDRIIPSRCISKSPKYD